MGRESKYRGFSKELNRWVVGDLVSRPIPYIVGEMIESNDEYCNLEFWRPVIAESVGQSTGLKDKSGKPIFEGDVIRGQYLNGVVCFGEFEINYGCNSCSSQEDVIGWYVRVKHTDLSDWNRALDSYVSQCEILGNIFENADLLTEQKS